ncbi:MAG: DinB family protein [Gemmatimonadota bacterium]
MTPRPSGPIVALVMAIGCLSAAPLRAQAVSDSAEFANWRQVHKEDVDGLRQKFMALARAIPADKLGWRPMAGSRSFHEVFAHIAAEGFVEPVGFGRPLPAGSVANFDAEEARLSALPDDQLLAAMDRAMENLSATFGGLSLTKMNTPFQFFGQRTFPRAAVTYSLIDLHEHLGQLVSYARMNQIVPPWSRRN